jgi:hypothetical protein
VTTDSTRIENLMVYILHKIEISKVTTTSNVLKSGQWA